jgi:hypothetical protein
MGEEIKSYTFFWLNVRFVTNIYLDCFRHHCVNTTQNFENWFPL